MADTVKAIHTFVAEHGDELEFQAGEEITVLERDDGFGDGWWRGRNARGEEGLFPATYIEVPAATPPLAEDPAPIPSTSPSPKSPPRSLEHVSPTIPPLATPLPVSEHSRDPIPQSPKAETPLEHQEHPVNEVEDNNDLGIGSSARARLAAQAQLANEAKDRQRASGGVSGLVYSDESDEEEDEEEDHHDIAAVTDTTDAIAMPADPVEKPIDPIASSPATSGANLQPALSLPSTPAMQSGEDPHKWTVDQVVAWAESKGFEDAISQKFKEHEITGDLLLELDANLLKELEIPQFGKRLRIAQAIAELRRPNSQSSAHLIIRSDVATPTPPLSTPPTSAPLVEQPPYAALTQSRPASSTMMPIHENQTSVPTTPVTPSDRRISAGSMGHKRGKSSMDNKDRLSFFGRGRKPAPTASPGDTKRMSGRPIVHQMTPATPPHSDISGTAVRQIGTPDHSGYMKKKGDRYGNWKTRFFVLKGSHLYFMKNEQEDRVKGSIDLRGYRVIVDENTNPGAYGFRLVGQDKPHAFSSSEQSQVREWMKALMKATIARDYTVPVTSSCNIPTIPLSEAQALSPRPPSPATREATQRASRRENTNQLTAHDANILMSLDQKPSVLPARPDRRPSTSDSPELLSWVNENLPPPYPKAAAIPSSFTSGEVIFLLVRHLSGLSPPVPPDAFAPEGDMPGLSGLFAMMDILIDAGVDTVGVSINDIRQGDSQSITRLLSSVKEWNETR